MVEVSSKRMPGRMGPVGVEKEISFIKTVSSRIVLPVAPHFLTNTAS